MIKINGSHGEGGGQVLRTSITLSAITNQPVIIRDIRKKRSKPGLMPQHLTGINAAAKICSAKVTGNTIGSTEITFSPAKK